MKQTEMELLREFAKFITDNWTLQKYWDGEPHSRVKDSDQLIREFKESRVTNFRCLSRDSNLGERCED